MSKKKFGFGQGTDDDTFMIVAVVCFCCLLSSGIGGWMGSSASPIKCADGTSQAKDSMLRKCVSQGDPCTKDGNKTDYTYDAQGNCVLIDSDPTTPDPTTPDPTTPDPTTTSDPTTSTSTPAPEPAPVVDCTNCGVTTPIGNQPYCSLSYWQNKDPRYQCAPNCYQTIGASWGLPVGDTNNTLICLPKP